MSLEHARSRMANGKMRQKLFVFFTCIIVIECRGLLALSVPQETNDGGSGIISEQSMSDHEGFDESLADFEHVGDYPSVTGQLVSSSEAAWDAMSPKLRCDDLMKLQLIGPEVAQIELCRGNGAPAPLAKLPPHCGHTIPIYRGLVYATPYDGCGIMQQGGSYVMQMQWQGNSAVISCPMISTTANETFLGPLTPAYLQNLLPHSPLDALSSAADTLLEPPTTETGEPSTPISQEILKPQPPGYPQAFLQRFWPYYHHQHDKPKPPEKPILTSIPSDASVAQVPIQKPQLPGYPQDFWPYYHHGKPKPPEKPVPISISSDTSVDQAPAQKPQLPGYPKDFWSYYYHHHHGKPKPPKKPVLTSFPTDTSFAQVPIQKPQLPGYPQDFWPYYYPHHYHGKPKPLEKPVTTSIPCDTSVDQAPIQRPQLPGYPQDFWPYYLHGKPNPPEKPVPTSISSDTSVDQAPAQKPQLPGYPQDFWSYYYHHSGKPKPPEIPVPRSIPANTSVAQAQAQKPHLQGYPQDFWSYYHHGKPKPLEKPVPTSIPSDTSVDQAPAKKPQIPGYPQNFWPYHNHHHHNPHHNPHHHHHHHHHGKLKPPEIPVPISIPGDTSVAQAPAQKPQILVYPKDFWPYYYPHHNPHHGKPKPPKIPVPTSMPTTSVAQLPAQKPQLPGYPQDLRSNYYPHYHNGKPKPPEKPARAIPIGSPSSSPVTTQKLQPPMYPGDVVHQNNYYHNYPLYLQSLYSQYPVQPPKNPTMPPITTTPQPCTTTAAAECKPSANQPLNDPPQYYIPLSSMFSEEDPITFHFVDFSEIAADSFP